MQVKKYVGISFMLLIMACNNATNQVETKKDSLAAQTNAVQVANLSFKDEKLQKIYGAYIVLKNALVATKSAEAQPAAKALAELLKSYSGCENTAVIAHKIENTNDIIVQRKEFTSLSNDVIALFKHADLSAGTIYVQHCPMANKGDGGDWLSSEKKIQNPYYGTEMMECGAVIEEIKAK